MEPVEVLPLGAGQDVGRSCCVVRMAGRTVMFDCGAHFGFKDARRFPEFGLLSRAGRFTDIIDALVITHFHIDHTGALPYFTEVCGYRGPILMTYPTFAIAPLVLGDYVKVNADRPGDRPPYTEEHVRECLRRVTAVDLHQEVFVAPGLSFTFYYAGHVLGAAMVHMAAGHLTCLYTGDFNSSSDRHLGPAALPTAAAGAGPTGGGLRRPDVLICEATYAATLRDSKRARERELLGAIVETVMAGGKVLIPTFAMGRAQELLMLLTDCWERRGLWQVPIYFSSAMASRATTYYQLLLNWTNANVRRTIFSPATPAPSPSPPASSAPGRPARPRAGRRERRGVEHGDHGTEGVGEGEGSLGEEEEADEVEEEDHSCPDPDSPSAAASPTRSPCPRSGVLPPDIRSCSRTEETCAARTAGDIRGGSDGVLPEADVYGMFRTSPWDRSLLQAPGPAVLFASPGNIASGVSLEAFRAWAGSPRNLVVLAGYQVRGTLGARLEALQGQGGAHAAAAGLEVPGGSGGGSGGAGRMEVRCRVRMLAFSAHADVRGLMGLVRRCRPRAVVLVHGQREPMEFVSDRIQKHLGTECHAPPTGTTVTLSPRAHVPLGVRPQLLTAAACAAAARGAVEAQDHEEEATRKRHGVLAAHPAPLTALPLSGIVVARASASAQPAGTVAAAVPGKEAAAVGAALAASASLLSLTDSSTAAKPLLAAHQGPPAVPYSVSYSCAIEVPPRRAAGTRGGGELPPRTARSEGDGHEVAMEMLGTAHRELHRALGGYAAQPRFHLDYEARRLRLGAFEAVLESGPRAGDAGGWRWQCAWAAAEEMIAGRCLAVLGAL